MTISHNSMLNFYENITEMKWWGNGNRNKKCVQWQLATLNTASSV